MTSEWPAVTIAPPAAETRPFYWSIRRELAENRSIIVAPLVAAALVVFAMMISSLWLPSKMRRAATLLPAERHVAVVMPYSVAPAPIMLVTLIVGFFYSIDALYGERRDRSILFWKSLPVSDAMTVLSKAAIPIVVLPLIAVLLSYTVFFFLLFFNTMVLLSNGMSPALLWSEVRIVQEPIGMLYGMVVHALWYAPLYAWLLLVSAWARRMPIVWAVLPSLLIGIGERMMFGTREFAKFQKYRLTGAMTEAFDVKKNEILDRLDQLDPIGFLLSPGLWSGLIVAAVFLAGAVRLRRDREPI